MPKPVLSSPPAWGWRIWPWATVGCGVWFLWRWVHLQNHGFEFTDEGFYFLVVQNPWAHSVGTFFGFFLHPLFLVCGGGTGPFRTGGLVLMGLGAVLAARAWLCAYCPSSARKIFDWPVTAVFVSGAWLIFSDGQRTPCYNYVVLFGAVLVWAGFFRLDGTAGKCPWAWSGMAAGLVVVLLGKWTAVPFLGAILGLLVFWKGWFRWINLAVFAGSFIVFLGLAGAYVGPLSVQKLLDGTRLFLEESHRQKVDYVSWYGVTLANFLYRTLRAFLYGAPVIILFAYLLRKRPNFFDRWFNSFWILPLFFLAGGLFFGLAKAGATSFSRVGSNVLAEVLWVTAAGILWTKSGPMRDQSRVWIPSLALFLTPFSLGVGTLVSLGDYVGQAALFFQIITCGLCLALYRAGGRSPLIATLLCLTAILNFIRLDNSLKDQFRIGSLSQTKYRWSLANQSEIFLDQARFKAMDQISGTLTRLGYRPGNPILAIGDMPGVVYLLGGWSPGAPWYMATSAQQWPYLEKLLESLDAYNRTQSYILFRVNSPIFSFTPKILEILGRKKEHGFCLENIDLEGDKGDIYIWQPAKSLVLAPVREIEGSATASERKTR